MITLHLWSHPVTGQDTHFSVNECQAGTDLSTVTWEREVKDHLGFGFQITADRKDVSTEEMLLEMMWAGNAETSFLLRALGWSEEDLNRLWDKHREDHRDRA